MRKNSHLVEPKNFPMGIACKKCPSMRNLADKVSYVMSGILCVTLDGQIHQDDVFCGVTILGTQCFFVMRLMNHLTLNEGWFYPNTNTMNCVLNLRYRDSVRCLLSTGGRGRGRANSLKITHTIFHQLVSTKSPLDSISSVPSCSYSSALQSARPLAGVAFK